jgi:hypothetical protein
MPVDHLYGRKTHPSKGIYTIARGHPSSAHIRVTPVERCDVFEVEQFAHLVMELVDNFAPS